MAAVPRRLKRIEVYCPEYKTTATIRVNDAHSSGTDHLEVDYRSPDHSHFTITIPDDWTDQDLLDLIFLPPRDPGPAELAGLGNSCLRLRHVQAVQVLERREEARQVNWCFLVPLQLEGFWAAEMYFAAEIQLLPRMRVIRAVHR